ncbi:hypothetical protein ACLOJK_016448 [Asimina triloba]
MGDCPYLVRPAVMRGTRISNLKQIGKRTMKIDDAEEEDGTGMMTNLGEEGMGGLHGGDGSCNGNELAALDLSLARHSLDEGGIRCVAVAAAAAGHGASTSSSEEEGWRETNEEWEGRTDHLHSRDPARLYEIQGIELPVYAPPLDNLDSGLRV